MGRGLAIAPTVLLHLRGIQQWRPGLLERRLPRVARELVPDGGDERLKLRVRHALEIRRGLGLLSLVHVILESWWAFRRRKRASAVP